MKKTGAEKGVNVTFLPFLLKALSIVLREMPEFNSSLDDTNENLILKNYYHFGVCLLYTSPSPRDKRQSRMPSSA